MKDLKWKKATQAIDKPCVIFKEGFIRFYNYALKGEYYIELEELRDLPKEDEGIIC